MSNSHKRIIVLFGGQSGEHEVSLKSAKSVLQAIDDNYDVKTIGISKEGRWYWGIYPDDLLNKEFSPDTYDQVTLVHDPINPRFISLNGSSLPDDGRFDLVFPVLHGPYGEDGTLQGLLEIANVPYVGSGVLGSSLGMDKDRMKAVFSHANLPIANHLTFLKKEYQQFPDDILIQITEKIGFPCFVKPANLGSSVGISKAYDRKSLADALNFAAEYDNKLIVEENIIGREIEVSVLGNDYPEASLPGEILPAKDFYDYDAKYNDIGSRLIIPAPLSNSTITALQEMAVKAFKSVAASGLGRVDFFVTHDDKILINEINTMPGFTNISMYPKLWEATGISYSEVINKLIHLAFERFDEKQNRKRA